MVNTYTARYTKMNSGYMGQLVDWPEVVTEGRTLEECREMLQDALGEMVKAYQQQRAGNTPSTRTTRGQSLSKDIARLTG